jgi:hypothetical protein
MNNYEVKITGDNYEEEITFQIDKKNRHEVLTHTKEKYPDYDTINIFIIEEEVPYPLYSERKELAAEEEIEISTFGKPTDSSKRSLPSLKLPNVEFQDSGWILLYRIAGWICVIGGFLVLLIGLASNADGSGKEAFVFFCCALLAASANFFAAHILRLQEKTAPFSEITAGVMEKHHALMVQNVDLLRSIAQKGDDKNQ